MKCKCIPLRCDTSSKPKLNSFAPTGVTRSLTARLPTFCAGHALGCLVNPSHCVAGIVRHDRDRSLRSEAPQQELAARGLQWPRHNRRPVRMRRRMQRAVLERPAESGGSGRPPPLLLRLTSLIGSLPPQKSRAFWIRASMGVRRFCRRLGMDRGPVKRVSVQSSNLLLGLRPVAAARVNAWP